MGKNFWQTYQSLVEPIPESLSIKRCYQNQKWTAVESECGCGLALNFESLDPEEKKSVEGKSLKEIASWVFSWNFAKASIGAAAVNTFWNQREPIEKMSNASLENLIAKISIEDFVREKFCGKKILFVGYFPFADVLKKDCKVTILERRSLAGALPDTACEALIPEQDLVIVSASTLINKTYVRLAQLSQNVESFLVGPTTPLTGLLAKDGFNQVSGLIIKDPKLLFEALRSGASREVLQSDISWKIDLNYKRMTLGSNLK